MLTPTSELGDFQHTVELPFRNFAISKGMTVRGTFEAGGVYFGEVTFATRDDAILKVISHTGHSLFKTGEFVRYIFNQTRTA